MGRKREREVNDTENRMKVYEYHATEIWDSGDLMTSCCLSSMTQWKIFLKRIKKIKLIL